VRDGGDSDYQSRQAAYNLEEHRGKDIVRAVGKTRRYEPTSTGLSALVALPVPVTTLSSLCSRHQCELVPRMKPNPTTFDHYYQTIRFGMQGVFRKLGLTA
jgi:hypothetical protein